MQLHNDSKRDARALHTTPKGLHLPARRKPGVPSTHVPAEAAADWRHREHTMTPLAFTLTFGVGLFMGAGIGLLFGLRDS